ncbi:MAG: flavocytochrome c [Tannerella sp.]|jgi:fumarate reductase flavoprotein subunit|nr:flavocytochrome c [Tannerella sp.]
MKKTIVIISAIFVVTLTGVLLNVPDTTGDVKTDVVIIGSGGAGLSAAIEVASKGVKVIVVEKNSSAGGNTNSANGMSTARSEKGMTEEESIEAFFNHTMEGGHNLNNPELVRILASKSIEIPGWVAGLEANIRSLDENHVTFGSRLVDILKKNCELLSVDLRLNTKAIAILTEKNKISGIEVEAANGKRYHIHAKAVIIASGGFGANKKLVIKHNPALEGFATTNQQGTTGDALQLVENLNVALVDMEQIQTHPTVVAGRQTTITEGMRSAGAILINHDGRRFVNETSTRDVVSKAILENESKTAFLIFDSAIAQKMKLANQYISEGYVTEAASIGDLAAKTGMNIAETENTVAKYNLLAKDGTDNEFGRPRIQPLKQAPFYAVEVTPAIHYTMGGIKINGNAEVIDNENKIIAGLFAAGEVTGGIHGANRLGGNSITNIIVFGRIAGQNAATYFNRMSLAEVTYNPVQ